MNHSMDPIVSLILSGERIYAQILIGFYGFLLFNESKHLNWIWT